MQDLNVIIRQNAKAVEEFAAKEARAGKYVVARYTGLNFHSYEAFDNERDRNAAAIKWKNESNGHTVQHLNPPVAA